MNLNNRLIGKCSQCGGVVSIPNVWWSVNRPFAKCEKCGAVAKNTLPIIETEKGKNEICN